MLFVVADIILDPQLPLEAIIGLTLVLTGASVWSYARQRRAAAAAAALGVVRLTGVLILALVLLNPSARKPAHEPETNEELLLLIDTSRSMLTADADGAACRLQRAQEEWLRPDLLRRLEEVADVRMARFDDAAAAASADELRGEPDAIAGGRSTDLAAALRAAPGLFRSQAHAGIVLISDGRDGGMASAADLLLPLAGQRVPVHTVCVGSSRQTPDLAIAAVPEQAYTLPGEPGRIRVRVYRFGLDVTRATVHHRGPDGDETIPVAFAGDEAATEIEVTHEEPGSHEHTFTVEAVEGEEVTANNSQSVIIETAPERMRVLIIEGEPHWDTKFIAQALRADERIDLTQATRLSARRTELLRSREGDANDPLAPGRIAEYDAVVLGRHVERLLSPKAAAELASAVTSGGRLMLARGRPTEDAVIMEILSPLLPGELGPELTGQIVAHPTRSARAHPAFSEPVASTTLADAFPDLPALSSVHSMRQLSAAATVLLETSADSGVPPQTPLLVSAPVGDGAVLAWLGQGHHRWSLPAPEAEVPAEAAELLWSTLTRMLIMGSGFEPGATVSLETSNAAVALGREITVSVRTRTSVADAASFSLEVTGEDGRAALIALTPEPASTRRLTGRYTPTSTGSHQLRLNAPGQTPQTISRGFTVYNDDRERLMTAADPHLMRLIAAETGGLSLDRNGPETLLGLLERKRESQMVPARLEPIWRNGWVLLLMTGVFGLEWLLRRAAGLM